MLKATDLMVNYGKSKIINGVSFEAGAKARIAILGRNGVGKTTLLKSLIGVLPLEAGAIEFEGRDIGKLSPYLRSRAGIGYVPQGREIISNLTVRENMELGMLGHKGINCAQQMKKVLEYFPSLNVHLERKGSVLSGRLQQQLPSRCLMASPHTSSARRADRGIQPNIVNRSRTSCSPYRRILDHDAGGGAEPEVRAEARRLLPDDAEGPDRRARQNLRVDRGACQALSGGIGAPERRPLQKYFDFGLGFN